AFESGGGGLVSTVDDYHSFCRMLLGKGSYRGKRILSDRSVDEMTTDQITPEQKANSPFVPGFWDNRGWGLGLSILKDPANPSGPRRFGWDGGYGTSAYSDPAKDMVGIFMTQQLMQSPSPTEIYLDFWKLADAAVKS
ncbi:serine hydrolase domain-containing protein, partial [Rhizobiaceae sp. 2RAB30]